MRQRIRKSVTHTAKALTAKQIAIGEGNGGADLTVDPDASTDGAGDVTAVSYNASEGTFADLTVALGTDLLCPNSTAHLWQMSNNGGTYVTVISTSDGVVAGRMPALTGDATTSAVAVSVVKVNGSAEPPSTLVLGSNSSSQLVVGTTVDTPKFAFGTPGGSAPQQGRLRLRHGANRLYDYGLDD